MRKNEIELFKELVTHIGKNYNPNPPVQLNGFLAMRGSQFNNDLMVVGRAVNGWGDKWLPSEVIDVDIAEKVATMTYDSIARSHKCPMLWVTNAWGRKVEYNTKKSAFWRVIRDVVGELNIADTRKKEWPSYLVWSNLYKISPKKGGNPSSALSVLQFAGCRNLLELEINKFTPKKILFLTGYDWASPFLNASTTILLKTSCYQQVKAMGNYQLPSGAMSKIVVATHPQGKKEAVWVKEVIDAFKDSNC